MKTHLPMNLSDKFRAFTRIHQHENPMLQLQHGKWFVHTFMRYSDWSAPQVKDLGVAVARWWVFMTNTYPQAIEAMQCPDPSTTMLKP